MADMTFELHGYKMNYVRKVGTCGRGTGVKVHLLTCREVVGVNDPSIQKPGTYGAEWVRQQQSANPRPVYFSVQASCNRNGQHTGRVFEHRSFDDITCEKCRARAIAEGLINVS